MATPDYRIRIANITEVDLAVEWAAREGWNPGLHDAPCYLRADPEGFLIGLLDGVPVATISALRYGAGFGFIGFYLVRPEWRGHGYGVAIFRAAMQRLSGRNVGLDGVVEQQANYQKFGFQLAYRNVRYAGSGGRVVAQHKDIVDLSDLSGTVLIDYERPFFPEARADFVRGWISQPGVEAVGMVCEGSLRGYAVMRRCRDGRKIGPLHADSAELAQALLHELLARAGIGESVFLDVPQANPLAVAIAHSNAMQPVFETARMYTGTSLQPPLDRVFGITSFEVG